MQKRLDDRRQNAVLRHEGAHTLATMFNGLSDTFTPFLRVPLVGDNDRCCLERNGMGMKSEPEVECMNTEKLPKECFYLWVIFASVLAFVVQVLGGRSALETLLEKN